MDQSTRELLEQYVTNADDQVFAIQNLQGMVGAVMARYSRAESGFRETLLREFIREDKLKLKKAYKLIDRVLIAYGDDSVGELEGSHLSFEGISLVATKAIEHRRIGGSPIEQSTRYIRYDFRDDQDNYAYVTPAFDDADLSARFRNEMDALFDGYGALWTPLKQYLEGLKPLQQATYDVRDRGHELYREMRTDKERASFERTYRNDIKTKTCDVLRCFLPLATRANVGLFGNGRFFQHLISRMLTSDHAEVVELGEKAFEELSKVVPHYVKRARCMDYAKTNEHAMRDLAARLFGSAKATDSTSCHLIDRDYDLITALAQQDGLPSADRAESELNLTTALIYPFVDWEFESLRRRVWELGAQTQQTIRDTYYGDRTARRDRPDRGLEHGYPFHFEMVTEWGVYKDLMRHRMGTMQVQPLVPKLGFEMPPEIIEAGLHDDARALVARAESLYDCLREKSPQNAVYAFLQGHRMRWMLGMNDRALLHMVELRTTVQGHPNYRRACQQMHRELQRRHPDRAARMSFVNHQDVYWSRGDSEARQRVKEAQLDGEGS